MAEVSERSELLPPRSENSIESQSDSSSEEQGSKYAGTSIRRLSSANLPPYHEDYPPTDEPSSTLTIWTVVPISLLGVFVANADGSLVIASSQRIASEFDVLSKASWAVTSFVLALCASQPLYGKFSDIFGRKANLITAYTFFGGGCLICGVAREFWHLIAGRAISGIGGAGMTALISIIIADMVAVRDVAAWRSYVNVAATLGRSLGGPVGGWLADTVGWRWSFLGQVPLTFVGLLLILWKFPKKTAKAASTEEQPFSQKIRRVDFLGALSLASTICALLLASELSTNEGAWRYALAAGITCIVLAAIFYVIERYWAAEPILPLGLVFRRDVITVYLIGGFQMAAQFGVFYCAPIYFQITASASVSKAGLHLVPAVVGNAVGGLASGFVVSATGRYKHLTSVASLAATIGYTLILIRWNGNTNWWEASYISLGGLGSGIIQSTTFVHLAASLDPSEIAIAGTSLYLAQNVLMLLGIQSATSALHGRLRFSLEEKLEGFKNRDKIIEQAISSIDYIWAMPRNIREIVTRAYVESLKFSYGVSIAFAFLGLLLGLTIKERKI